MSLQASDMKSPGTVFLARGSDLIHLVCVVRRTRETRQTRVLEACPESLFDPRRKNGPGQPETV
jgi:hypothetical protein